MATPPNPMMAQQGGGAPSPQPPQGGGAPGGQQPSQGQAPPELMLLARVHQLFARLAQSNPVLSAGLQKAMDGINEAQSAMVSQPRPTPTGANPPM